MLPQQTPKAWGARTIEFYLLFVPEAASPVSRFGFLWSLSPWCTEGHCLSQLRLKQQVVMSHSSGCWEVQGQGTGRFSIWSGATSRFLQDCLLTVPSHGGKELSWVSFVRGWIPFPSALPSWSDHLSKTLPPNTVTLERKFQPLKVDRAHKHSFWSRCLFSPCSRGLLSVFLSVS